MGTHVAFYGCGRPGLELVGAFAPGWALGGPLAAALVSYCDDSQMSARARIARWTVFVGLSVIWCLPVGCLVFLMLYPFVYV